MESALQKPQVVSHLLRGDGEIPNNETLPLLAYRAAVRLPSSDPASLFEEIFAANEWTGSWRNGIFPFHHFHCNAHEVLGVYSGSAIVQLGGKQGITLTVEPGDVVILPAGMGHKKLSSRGGLGIVGAYPRGQHPDMCRGNPGSYRQRVEEVARVPMPARDPVFGAEGPLFEHWHA